MKQMLLISQKHPGDLPWYPQEEIKSLIRQILISILSGNLALILFLEMTHDLGLKHSVLFLLEGKRLISTKAHSSILQRAIIKKTKTVTNSKKNLKKKKKIIVLKITPITLFNFNIIKKGVSQSMSMKCILFIMMNHLISASFEMLMIMEILNIQPHRFRN